MRKVLLLGGTAEARSLAEALAGSPHLEVVSSLAGRIADPRPPIGEVRIGGFGGVERLREWLITHHIDVVVDATHPFAARITANAAIAAAAIGVPVVHLCRPGWVSGPSDRWTSVANLAEAANCAAELGRRIFLTIGRQGVNAFAGVTEPWFLIRSIDPPADPLPLRHELLLARGPFTLADETLLFESRQIDVLVTKNSGGDATVAKLEVARAAGIPVLMIDRPALPAGAQTVDSVAAAIAWLERIAQLGSG